MVVKSYMRLTAMLGFLLVAASSVPVIAQDEGMIPEGVVLPPGEAMQTPVVPAPKEKKPELPSVAAEFMPSLFLEPHEIALINEAQRGFINNETGGANGSGSTSTGGARFIKLSGLLFNGPGKWVVWVNGERVTPENIPPEIVDIRVGSETVRMKWYDQQTNKIYNVRLRVHQSYNIDSGLIMPG